MSETHDARADGLDSSAESACPPRRPWWQRLLIGLAVAVIAVAVLGFALYNFGGISGSANDPAMKQDYEALAKSGQVEPVEKRFTIPIPGCKCHSTDPYLTEQHRYRHMNECMGCHSGG